MDKELVAKYLNSLKDKTGLTYKAIAEKAQKSESTVKNLFFANVDDPRLDTVAPTVYAMDGSIDEMLNPNKKKEDSSTTALIESYEQQIAFMAKTQEEQKGHYETRLADKDAHIKDLKKTNHIKNVIITLFVIGVVVLFTMELLHPQHGWLRS